MPRSARRRSLSETYHVVARGTSHQIIFETDDDRAFFMARASEYASKLDGEIYAWCLMDNHVHLLVRIGHEGLSRLMHALLAGYAGYFNRVHGRTGHLFEGRYQSEPVDTDGYLAAVVRYIHRNPIKAGITRDLGFPWSSYGEYAGGTAVWASTDMVLEVLGGKDGFVRFHAQEGEDDKCLDIPECARRVVTVTDAAALSIASDVLGEGTLQQVKSMPRDRRDEALAALKDQGITVRQIQRLTGVSLGVISQAGK